MHLRVGVVTAAAVGVAAGCVLSSCGGSPSKNAVRATTTTAAPTTSTSSAPSTTTTTTHPGVTVPDVIGLKIAAAHATLRQVGLPAVGLNTPCNKGTLASQSVVASLWLAGHEPDVQVGAVPLHPGAAVPPATRVGITWSGCYGGASAVPAVVGVTFPAARHALHAVGLTWACYSVGQATTTTTTVKATPRLVLTQSPAAGTVLHPGATVALTMHACPQ
jgi:beta-lactam-binding protein with PASTA domain